jgi:hypothetical protein
MSYTKRRNNLGKTVRNRGNNNAKLFSEFTNQITVLFLEMIMMIKLFHWNTHSYATHKATDELHEKLNSHVDRFMEVLFGKTGKRINLTNKKNILLFDLTNNAELINKINLFKDYLVNLNSNKALNILGNYDLLTIRDEILADLNQFLYLLSFK